MRIISLRGTLLESTHALSVAVSDSAGRVTASCGDPERVTVLRSAAKPFQALPLLLDGAAERFGLSDEELALACASHNSERSQVAVVAAWLERIGCAESDLACGPHPPLSTELAVPDPDTPAPDPAPRSPLASNCSGKHTGMLTLARHHGWPTAGYNAAGHAVQDRILEVMSEYADVDPDAIGQAVDGCTAVTFGLPLRNMALSFARLVSSRDPAPRRVVHAMVSRPDLVAGHGRLCTDLMAGYPGLVLAKVGADGVYGAALIEQGLGIALKVEDGNWRACNVALIAVLEQLGLTPPPSRTLSRYATVPVRNTRGQDVGVMRAEGALAFPG
jgi:L-asparaginase II